MRFCLQPGGYNRQAQMAALGCRDAVIAQTPDRDACPIGSVEWTADYAQQLGLPAPSGIPTYPVELWPWLWRDCQRDLFGRVPADRFVKPLRVKAFTGGIRRDIAEPVDPAEPVWSCELVAFAAEWRCLVLGGRIVSVAQYGDGDDAECDVAEAQRMVDAWPAQPVGWALDVGIIGKQLAMVEANDGWALGFYSGHDRAAYLRVIFARWAQLCAAVDARPEP